MFSPIIKLGYGILPAIFFLSLLSTTTYASEPSIARATFTSGIKNREPINRLTTANQSMPKIYFFTEIQNYRGKSVTHRWMYNNWVVQQVSFRINSHRWRTYSAKTLLPEKGLTGDWKVEVLDANGKVIGEQHFTYVCEGYCPKEEVKKPKKKIQAKKKSRKTAKKRKKSFISKVKKTNSQASVNNSAQTKAQENSSDASVSTVKAASEAVQDTSSSEKETSTGTESTVSSEKSTAVDASVDSQKASSTDQAPKAEPAQSIGQAVQSELRSVVQEAKDDILFDQ